jgi:hypothetical protein
VPGVRFTACCGIWVKREVGATVAVGGAGAHPERRTEKVRDQAATWLALREVINRSWRIHTEIQSVGGEGCAGCGQAIRLAAQAPAASSRSWAGPRPLVGRSCEGLDHRARAARKGASPGDFVRPGPTRPDATHGPDRPQVGIRDLRASNSPASDLASSTIPDSTRRASPVRGTFLICKSSSASGSSGAGVSAPTRYRCRYSLE